MRLRALRSDRREQVLVLTDGRNVDAAVTEVATGPRGAFSRSGCTGWGAPCPHLSRAGGPSPLRTAGAWMQLWNVGPVAFPGRSA